MFNIQLAPKILNIRAQWKVKESKHAPWTSSLRPCLKFCQKTWVKKVQFLALAWLFACKSQCVHLGVESCKTLLNVYHSVYFLLLLVHVQHSLPPVVHMQLHPPVTPEGPTPGGLPLGGGYLTGSCRGHFSSNPPISNPPHPPVSSHQVAISLFRPPGKSWNS